MQKSPEFSMFITTRGLHVMPLNLAAAFLLSVFDDEGHGIMDFDQAIVLLYDDEREMN